MTKTFNGWIRPNGSFQHRTSLHLAEPIRKGLIEEKELIQQFEDEGYIEFRENEHSSSIVFPTKKVTLPQFCSIYFSFDSFTSFQQQLLLDKEIIPRDILDKNKYQRGLFILQQVEAYGEPIVEEIYPLQHDYYASKYPARFALQALEVATKGKDDEQEKRMYSHLRFCIVRIFKALSDEVVIKCYQKVKEDSNHTIYAKDTLQKLIDELHTREIELSSISN